MTAVSSSTFPELSGAHYPLAGLCHIVFLTQTKKRQAAIWLPAVFLELSTFIRARCCYYIFGLKANYFKLNIHILFHYYFHLS